MTTGQCTMNALLVAQSICLLRADGPAACRCSLSMRYRDVAAQETTQKTSRATTVHHSCCWPVMGRKITPLSPDTTANIMFTVVSPSANTAEKNAHVAPQMVAQCSHNGRTMVAAQMVAQWSHKCIKRVHLLGTIVLLRQNSVVSTNTPHFVSHGQRIQTGFTNPHRVLALGWCNHLDPHGRWGQGSQLLCHPALKQLPSTRTLPCPH